MLGGWIGFDTHSEREEFITRGIFIAYFFNTAVLMLIVNANASEHGFIGEMFNYGTFFDYSP